MEYDAEIVNARKVVCSGPEWPHNHPTVYYLIPEDRNYTICFYCSKKFIYEEKVDD